MNERFNLAGDVMRLGILLLAFIVGCASHHKGEDGRDVAQSTDSPIQQKMTEWESHVSDTGGTFRNTVDSLLQGDLKKNITSFMTRHLNYIQIVQSMTD